MPFCLKWVVHFWQNNQTVLLKQSLPPHSTILDNMLVHTAHDVTLLRGITFQLMWSLVILMRWIKDIVSHKFCQRASNTLQWHVCLANFCETLFHKHLRRFCTVVLLRSEIPSGICAKLRTVAASNNRDHPTRSLYYCLFASHT